MSEAKVLKFRLNGGKHEDDYGRKYVPGDVIASQKPLDEMFVNVFTRIDPSTPDKYHGEPLPTKKGEANAAPSSESTNQLGPKKRANPNDIPLDLETMTVQELQQLAIEEEIDLKKATKKDEIIRLIREAQVASAK